VNVSPAFWQASEAQEVVNFAIERDGITCEPIKHRLMAGIA